MSISSESTQLHGTGDKSTNRPASNWHIAEDPAQEFNF